MFASLSKYSPKQLLASYLSKALAHYFNVDPSNVETSLVHDAKVVLRDVQIQPQIVAETLSQKSLQVSGNVESIEFSWTWDSQSLVSNATLTIQGVSIRVSLIEPSEHPPESESALPESVEKEPSTTSNPNGEASNQDWRARYLQQIIDHLTLAIADVEIRVDLPQQDQGEEASRESALMLRATGVSLKTVNKISASSNNLAVVPPPFLQQEMSVTSLEAWIQEQCLDDAVSENFSTRTWVLDPFGYYATIQRVSGRRFLDGVLSGLLIQGIPEETEVASTIRLHAGVAQLTALGRLQEILLSFGDTPVQPKLPPMPTMDDDIDITEVALQMSKNIHSVLRLPVPALELVLDTNDTTLRFSQCTIHYCTDGSELSIECTNGLWMEDTVLMPLSSGTGKNYRWLLDFVSRDCTLDSVPVADSAADQETYYDAVTTNAVSDETAASIREPAGFTFFDDNLFEVALRLDMLRKLWAGIHVLLPQSTEIAEHAVAAYQSGMSREDAERKSWIVRTNGSIKFSFTFDGNSRESAEVVARCPVATFAEGGDAGNPPASFSFGCQGMTFRSQTHGGIVLVELPAFSGDGHHLSLAGAVLASAPSTDVLRDFREVWAKISSAFSRPDDLASSGFASDSGAVFRVPSIELKVQNGPVTKLDISDVLISASSSTIGLLKASGPALNVECKTLRCVLDESITFDIGELSTLDLGTALGRLQRPTLNLKIQVAVGGMVQIVGDTVHFECPVLADLVAHNIDGQDASGDPLGGIDFPISCQVGRLIVMPEFGPGKLGVCLDSLCLEVVKEGTSSGRMRLRASCKYVQGRGPMQSEIALKGLRMEATVDTTNAISCSMASTTVMEITTLRVPHAAQITKPIGTFNCLWDGSVFDVKCDAVHAFCFVGAPAAGSHVGSSRRAGDLLSIRYPLCFAVALIQVETGNALDSPSHSANLSNFVGEIHPATQETQLVAMRVMVAESSLHGTNSTKLSVSGIALSTKWKQHLSGHDKFAVPGFGELHFASFEVNSCSELKMDGIGSLVQPCQHCKVSYHNGSLSIDLGLVHFDVLQVASIPSDGADRRWAMPHGFDETPILLSASELRLTSIIGRKTSSLQIRSAKVTFQPAVSGREPSIRADCYNLNATSSLGNIGLCGLSIDLPIPSRRGIVSGDDDFPPSYFGGIAEASLHVDKITEMAITGRARLATPMTGVILAIKDGVVEMRIDLLSLEALHMTPQQHICVTSPSDQLSTQAAILPNFPLSIRINRILVSGSGPVETISSEMCIESFSVLIQHQIGGATSVDLECSLVQALFFGDTGAVASGIRATLSTTAFGSDGTTEPNSDIVSTHRISNGSVEIAIISELFAPSIGYLAHELRNTSMSYGLAGTKIQIGEVMIRKARGEVTEPYQLSRASTTFLSVPLDIDILGIRIDIEEIGTIECGRTRVEYQLGLLDSSSNHTQLQFASVHCRTLSGGRLESNTVSIVTQAHSSAAGNAGSFYSVPGLGYVSTVVIKVGEVSECTYPEFWSLARPLNCISAKFDTATGVEISLQDVAFTRDISNSKVSSGGSLTTAWELLSNVKLSVSSMAIAEVKKGQIVTTWKACTLAISFEPVLAKISTSAEGPGCAFYATCRELSCTQSKSELQASNLTASGLLQFSLLDRIGNLDVGIENATLSADFSSAFWSKPVEIDVSAEMSLKLPFVVIQGFNLTLNGNGQLISLENAIVSCSALEGDRRATSESVTSHFVKIVKGRIPYLLSKTNIVGSNVGDNIGMVAGSMVLNNSLIGSTVGVAARDAVGGALTMGKESRGASSTDKYQFGDLTRGVVASARSAVQRGSRMRGDDKYVVGDFTAGTASAAGEYASQNRVRLAGAGGSALGMVAGLAVTGPIGLVAGSFLGSSAAQKSMRSVAGDPSANLDETKPAASPSNQKNKTDNQTISHVVPFEADIQAEWVGDIAASDRRAVMVQAQVVSGGATSCTSVQSLDLLSDHFVSSVVNVAPSTPVSPPNPSPTARRAAPCSTNQGLDSQWPMNGGTNHPLSPEIAMCAHHQTEQFMTEDHLRIAPPADPRAAFQWPQVASSQPHSTYGLEGHQEVARNQQAVCHRDPVAVLNATRARPSAVAAGPNSHVQAHAAARGRPQLASEESQGYRFGDVTRGIIARGKQVDGRDAQSGYKFGDFTRGLFR